MSGRRGSAPQWSGPRLSLGPKRKAAKSGCALAGAVPGIEHDAAIRFDLVRYQNRIPALICGACFRAFFQPVTADPLTVL